MRWIVTVLKGAVIGIANIIPGVSGGTMAFLLGIYKKLTDALGNVLLEKTNRGSRLIFLFLVFIGAVMGIAVFARLFSFLLERPVTALPTYAFFGGLILGSIPFLLRAHHDMKPSSPRIVAFFLGLLPVLLLALIRQNPAEMNGGTDLSGNIGAGYALWLALCGFLGAGSMIVPGFSGSALLVALGEYRNILTFVDERMVLPLLVLVLGIIPGIILFAKLISYLLKQFPAVTFFCILGLVTGSVFHVAKEITLLPRPETYGIIGGILFFLGGIAVSYALSLASPGEETESE